MHEVDRKGISGVIVATIMQSIVFLSMPALTIALLAALSAISLLASLSAAKRRWQIPVLVLIHSSEVSTIFDISSLVIILSGV